jgi:hypothetical protein
MTKTAAVITGMITFMVLMTCLTIQEAMHLTHDRTVQAVTPVAAQAPAPIVVHVVQQPTTTAATPARTQQVTEAKATKKAEKPAPKATKAPAPTKAPKATKAPSNEELAYRIDQLAEDTCERGRGGKVAEDYTCVDYHGKAATPKAKATDKAPATNAASVPLGEGKQRCPNGYQRDKADRTLCVAKA